MRFTFPGFGFMWTKVTLVPDGSREVKSSVKGSRLKSCAGGEELCVPRSPGERDRPPLCELLPRVPAGDCCHREPGTFEAVGSARGELVGSLYRLISCWELSRSTSDSQ